MNFYQKTVEDSLAGLETTPVGLNEKEIHARQQKYGLNELKTETAFNPLAIFFSQFKSFIIYILLFAVAFSLIIGEYVDSIIILIILLINALIGFFQELSAHKSLAALKELTTVQAAVLRNGRKVVMDSRQLVPGDIIYLEAGDKVPADARILEFVNLAVDESSLTGESLPVEKNNSVIPSTVQIGEQVNMLFSSTAVVAGNGRAVVVSTGMATEIGKITGLVREAEEEPTPLQKRLDSFGRKLGYVIIAICFVVFCMSCGREYLLHLELSQQFLISLAFVAISLAVAAVPTALPAVVTIALSVGVKRLLAKKALVRKLSSVETLGSCDVICTDKTGTLTKNEMTVRKAWTLDGEAEISGTGYEPVGEISGRIEPLLFQIGFSANNSSVYEEKGEWRKTGDPTEAALMVSGMKSEAMFLSRHAEMPFDSDRKCMSVIVAYERGRRIMSKGAPDRILERCSHVLIQGRKKKLTEEHRQKILAQNDLYSSEAMRVLAFACKDIEQDENEQDLVFVGLQAMIDPPRTDVIEAVARTKEAGIRVIMITGDYKETARAIGREVGIEGRVLTGEEVEYLSDDELREKLAHGVNIFARVVPVHKQRIVTALQELGHTVAMTGDGVNDAPALKKANIGVAVGSGTEVAKEASDFVLLDDSFSNIVNAIEEGRGIYDNIQKSIMLLLSGNLGEVLIIFLAVISGMNLPLTAILLLWINMVTDGAPALAYSVDPYGTGIMSRPPKPRDEGILPGPKLALISFAGLVGTGIGLFLFSWHGGNSDSHDDLILAQTMVFNFIVLYEIILVFIIRRAYQVPLFSNKWIWASVVLSVLLQVMLMYTPMHLPFSIVPLAWPEIMNLFFAGLVFYATFWVYDLISRPSS
ncbi:MAG: cation-translocating P-type ATPase [Desulfobulbaceae bacterium]|nr:cation-translocating P-type ATPase [Desulfobulbaceae bacterium]